ncbi:MAG: DoxX family protein [Candidatus Veblenbacteria bacterium]|nr:DoxX family protein [Candidatus Veblenbacteria bacterium]
MPDFGLLLLRLGLGSIFVAHGWAKWQNFEATTAFFASLGLPQSFVYLVAATELLGGLTIIGGMLTRLASFGLAIIMVVAIVQVKFSLGFVGGYEFELLLLLVALALVLLGPGHFKFLRFGPWSSEPL